MIDMVTKNNGDESINRRLDALIGILLNQTTLQEATTKEKITFLISFDFDYKEISRILQISQGFVAKEKSLLKKSGKDE